MARDCALVSRLRPDARGQLISFGGATGPFCSGTTASFCFFFAGAASFAAAFLAGAGSFLTVAAAFFVGGRGGGGGGEEEGRAGWRFVCGGRAAWYVPTPASSARGGSAGPPAASAAVRRHWEMAWSLQGVAARFQAARRASRACCRWSRGRRPAGTREQARTPRGEPKGYVVRSTSWAGKVTPQCTTRTVSKKVASKRFISLK